MAIYSRFGSKGGVLDGLFREGVDQLDRAHAALDVSGDPVEHVLALSREFRRVAHTFPGHYRLMFGDPIPGYVVSEDNRARVLGAYQRLREAIGRAVSAGAVEGDPDALTFLVFVIWL